MLTKSNIRTYDRRDPTRTTALRNAFARDMLKRFKELIGVLLVGVDQQDVFGLRSDVSRSLLSFQMQAPGTGAFAFARNTDKVIDFMRWLESQVDAGILTTGELDQIGVSIHGAWTNKYIFDSYKRGLLRARYEMNKAGGRIPSIEETGGIEISMSTPLHLDRLGLLYTRVFSDLKGITSVMDTHISRILAQGLADGDNPRLLARKLVATISGQGVGDLGLTDALGRFIPAQRRAEILARTEIIRAHHQGMIQEYMNWGVEGVTVQAEWKTAGDRRVCSECEAMEGSKHTLDSIMNMIPLHPQCRCIALPYRKEWEGVHILPENTI